MKEWLRRLEKHLAIERNVSPHTLRAYCQDLSEFLVFLTDGKDDRVIDSDDLRRIDKVLLRRYLAVLHRKNRRSTIGRKLAALRTFFRYLVREGVLEANPGETLSTPRQERYLPKTLTVDEAFALMTS